MEQVAVYSDSSKKAAKPKKDDEEYKRRIAQIKEFRGEE